MSRVLAMDCEMVGSYGRSILARVTIVDPYGAIVLDEYVRPTAPVTDYRSFVSGVRKFQLDNGQNFSDVRDKVATLISGCTLVGHSLQCDLDTLGLSHPESRRRDLAKYDPFLKVNGGQPVALKLLADHYLGRVIQSGPHDSAEDARACMEICLKFPHNW